MAYTTAANVRIVLKKVSTAAMSDSDVGVFIGKADALCNSYIASRYSLPLATTPPAIEAISTDIAAYFIMRTLYTRDNTNTSDWVYFYKDAIKSLELIRDGKMKLISTAGAEYGMISVGTLSSNTMNYHTTFDMDETESSVIDTDLINDIQTEKE